MRNSPCAKLMTSSTPQIKESPDEIRA